MTVLKITRHLPPPCYPLSSLPLEVRELVRVNNFFPVQLDGKLLPETKKPAFQPVSLLTPRRPSDQRTGSVSLSLSLRILMLYIRDIKLGTIINVMLPHCQPYFSLLYFTYAINLHT